MDGSTLELSADGPLRPPFAVYMQGGTHWTHWMIVLRKVLADFADAGGLELEALRRVAAQPGDEAKETSKEQPVKGAKDQSSPREVAAESRAASSMSSADDADQADAEDRLRTYGGRKGLKNT